jgi:DNA-binding NarL/FixJ family response regulator
MMSSPNVPATIIGPKGLLRDSLASLLGTYSYRVTDSHETAADMPRPTEDEGPRVVLLTVRTMELAIAEAVLVKQVCPNCKIVALLEDIPGEGFWKLAHSDIDGCVPLRVSQDILTRTLDLVMSDATRVILLADDNALSAEPVTEGQQKVGSGPGGDTPPRPQSTSTRIANNGPSLASKSGAAAVTNVSDACLVSKTPSKPILAISNGNGQRLNSHLTSASRHTTASTSPPAARWGEDGNQSASDGEISIVSAAPVLSERERQIIAGLVKGQPNKIIARVCGITEATVKVHMKAILRKVPCSNRTQVAIWALDHTGILPRPDEPGQGQMDRTQTRRMAAFRAARSSQK